jgi:hypothetical protein
MSTNTTEAALEACIERQLTGGTSGATSDNNKLNEDPAVYQTSKGAG